MYNSVGILLKYLKYRVFFFAWICKKIGNQRWRTHHPQKNKNKIKNRRWCKFINWEHVTLDANSKGMVCLESFCLLVSYFGSD